MLESDLNRTSSAFIVDTAKFSSEDLDLFLNSSRFIEETREKRRLSQVSPHNVYKSREEIFEVTEVNEMEFCEIASSVYDDIAVNIKNLSADIEKLFDDLDDDESGCCSAESDVDVPIEKKSLEPREVAQYLQRNKIVARGSISGPRVTRKLKSIPLIRSSSSEKWPPKQQIESTTDKIEFQKLECVPTMNVKDRISFFNRLSSSSAKDSAENKPQSEVKPATKKTMMLQTSYIQQTAQIFAELTETTTNQRSSDKDNEKVKAEAPKRPKSQKPYIQQTVQVFTKLTESTANQRSSSKNSEKVKAEAPKLIKSQKTCLQETAQFFTEVTASSAMQKSSVKYDEKVKAETPKPSKNLVKNRIDQFESALRGDRPHKSVIKKHSSNLCDFAKNSVRKIRVLFEQNLVQPNLPEDHQQQFPEVLKQNTGSIKSTRSKFIEEVSKLYATPRKSFKVLEKAKVFKQSPRPPTVASQKPKSPACEKRPSSTLCKTSTASNISISSSCVKSADCKKSKTSLPFVKLPTQQHSDSYNPFIESEKSSQKLSNLIHTIQSIRDQGMTDVSRDLFHIFKKCLCAANEKLADPKQQTTTIHDSASKRVAAVTPTVNSTYPRVLKVIPKKRSSENLEIKLCPEAFRKEMTNKGLNESILTYERFVSILGQTTHGRD